MGYRRLFVWVEGGDDLRFFDTVIKAQLEKKYDLVEVRPCANMKREKIERFLTSIKAMGGHYVYVTDIDGAPCITARKQEILDGLRNVDENRIVVVIKEVESWYISGLSNPQCKNLGIPILTSTDSITKEQFDNLVPKKFYSRIQFMLEILGHFSIQIAKRKNKSFKYFIDKYNC